ncbi:MAG: DUF3570 domain-containing protein [Myxococcales bacterium]|nr:DUF3570 domain-containing protein [Myxococcales bacterium]
MIEPSHPFRGPVFGAKRPGRAARSIGLRVGFIVSLAMGLCATTTGLAQTTGKSGVTAGGGTGAVLVYVDDNNTQVIKTTTSGRAVHGKTTTSAVVGFDFITAASVDLVTAASPHGFSERRTQVGTNVDHNFGQGTRMNGGYNLSHEPDYLTHAMRIGGQYELFARHLILSAGYGLSLSEVGRRNDSVFKRNRHSHDLNLTATRIVTRTLALDLSYGLSLVRGFQANAYRYVRLYDGTSIGNPMTSHLTAVRERAPDERVRHTAGARVRWRMASGLFVHGGYRGYVDTWGLTAHTGTARLLWSPHQQWSLALRGRGHVQGAVGFYQAQYRSFPDVPALRTADKELGPLWTGLVGLQLEWSPPLTWADGLHVGTGADWLHMRYLDFPFLDRRNALMLTFDVTLEL